MAEDLTSTPSAGASGSADNVGGSATGAAALRRAWLHELTHRTDWDLAGWRTPAVDAVAGSLAGPRPARGALERALRGFAAERANGGGSLENLLTELTALDAALPGELPQLARAAVIDAWVDAAAARRGAPTLDPVTGLHTPAYLIGRVHELDRMAGSGEPPHLVLLTTRWLSPASPWVRAAVTTHVSSALRTNVRPAATLCQLGPNASAALVPDDGQARSELNQLVTSLDAEPMSSAGVTTELIPVPDRRDDLTAVLEAIAATPPKPVQARESHVRMRAAE